MTDDQPLNADAIYAAMAWLRVYAETPEGEAAFHDLKGRKAREFDAFRAMLEGTSDGLFVSTRAVFELPDATKEQIYAGQLDSVNAGITLASAVLLESLETAFTILEDVDPKHPMRVALSQYVADRAN